MSFNIGDLAPGQSRTQTVVLKSTKRGKHCNTATASSANAGTANAEACTTILVPGVELVKTGTKEQFLGKAADYTLTVSNTGDAHGRLEGSLDAVDNKGRRFELVPEGTPILPGQTRTLALMPKGEDGNRRAEIFLQG